MNDWLLGVDVGGTSTRAVLAPVGEGEPRKARAPGANPNRVGVEGAVTHLRRALGTLFAEGPAVTPVAACVGIAGLSHPAIRDVLRAAFRDVPEAPHRVLVDDGTIAWVAAFEAAPAGTLVMAGTGSAALVRRADASIQRVGGLGPLLGDEGSGHQLGLQALRAAARAAEGRAPRGPLCERVLEKAGVTEVRQLSQRAVAGLLSPPDFFRPLVEAAGLGDPLAVELLQRGGRELADLVRRAQEQGPEGEERISVATSGSVLGRGTWVRDALFADLAQDPTLDVEDRGHVDEPVRGALFLARQALTSAETVPPGW